jgi:sigma-B regulation protein RsbU (phosphoserine phosphatase)
MALTMSAVAIYAQESGPPAEVMRHVHRALIKELETTEMYLTLFYGVIDPRAGHLVYANAGHPHAFLIGVDGKRTRLGATAPPLGIAQMSDYGEDTIEWSADGSLICLFTDGLTDVYPDGGAGAGEPSLIADVISTRDQPLETILNLVFTTAQGAPMTTPADDRTALLVRG